MPLNLQDRGQDLSQEDLGVVLNYEQERRSDNASQQALHSTLRNLGTSTIEWDEQQARLSPSFLLLSSWVTRFSQ